MLYYIGFSGVCVKWTDPIEIAKKFLLLNDRTGHE